jgi:hypothetical protein
MTTLDSKVLPKLQLFAVEALYPHEDYDNNRVRKLSIRLKEDGFLKNPPIVSEVPESDRYVILDGANRVTAFQQAGIPHIVAQMVSYDDPGVALETWNHVICGLEWAAFSRELAGIPGLTLKVCTQEEARREIETREAVAYMINDQGSIALKPTPGSGSSRMKLLSAIVGTYRGKADIIRASNDLWEIQKPCYEDITTLLVFARLKPEDVLQAGRDGERIPSGLTRHVIPGRAVNINIPMQILWADWTLERKRGWLDEWWTKQLANNSIRYYAETTFSFNE